MAEELAETPDRDRKFAVTVTERSQTKRVLGLEISPDMVAAEEARIAVELRRDLRVPGFRKGKVPAGYVTKNYADLIHSDAVRNLLAEAYEYALDDAHIHPLGEPHFENVSAEQGAAVTADAVIDVRPDVEIKGYRGLTVKFEPKVVADADVESTIADMRGHMAVLENVDREAIATDCMIIDYAPYHDSSEIDEKARHADHAIDLTSETLLSEFREGLVGMKKGDAKDIDVRYPDNFGDAAMAGQSKRFSVRVVEVQEKLLPEVDDAFAKRVDEAVGGIDDLRTRIRTELETRADHDNRHEIENLIIGGLIERNSFEVPDVMVSNYLSSILEEDRRRRPRVADEAARESEVREIFQDAAVRSIKKFFIMDAVRRQEDIKVEEADIEGRIAELATGSGRSPDEVRKLLAEPQRRRNLEDDLVDKKVFEFLHGVIEVKST